MVAGSGSLLPGNNEAEDWSGIAEIIMVAINNELKIFFISRMFGFKIDEQKYNAANSEATKFYQQVGKCFPFNFIA